MALEPLAEGLWIARAPMRPLPFLDIGTRMTVVRAPDGGVLLHSPVPADAPLRDAVRGSVPCARSSAPTRCITSTRARGRKRTPPRGCSGRPGSRRSGAISRSTASSATCPSASFAGALDCHLVKGMPVLNEVAFLHRASRTLLLTDLAFHPTPASPRGTRLWCRLARTGAFGPTPSRGSRCATAPPRARRSTTSSPGTSTG